MFNDVYMSLKVKHTHSDPDSFYGLQMKPLITVLSLLHVIEVIQHFMRNLLILQQ